MMMPVIAHAGDWVSTIIILAPTFAVIAWLGLVRLRERRGREEDSGREQSEGNADDISSARSASVPPKTRPTVDPTALQSRAATPSFYRGALLAPPPCAPTTRPVRAAATPVLS